jgi:AcrR family transcriptional regulator
VGIGTLYRHFPRREALVEAVYEDQVERLSASARELLAQHPPAEAFRSWMTVFIDWAATKHGMTDTLRALMSSGRIEHGRMRAQLIAIVSLFLDAGGAAGTFAPTSAPPMWPQHSLASWSSPVLPTSGRRRRACSTSFWMASVQ